jgi:hypothetical protein
MSSSGEAYFFPFFAGAAFFYGAAFFSDYGTFLAAGCLVFWDF